MQDLSLAESWEYLTDKLTRLIEQKVPKSKISPDTAKMIPYVNQASLDAIKVKHRKWTKYRNSMSDKNYDAYKTARNKVKTELRKAKYDYEKDLAGKIKTDNKLFWSGVCNHRIGLVPPLYIVGILGASITELPASHQIVILNWKWTPMKLSKEQGY